jgi:hypothetical protein
MMIIGCDFHTRYQQIAMLDEATGGWPSLPHHPSKRLGCAGDGWPSRQIEIFCVLRGANHEAGLTLRTGTAGSQDESRVRAIQEADGALDGR